MDLPSNLWKSPVIQSRFLLEANFEGHRGFAAKPYYWVIVPEADTKEGHIVIKNFKPNLQDAEPHPLQQDFAQGLQDQLMKEAHFYGLWTVGWTHPPSAYDTLTDTNNCWGRLIFIWHDKDGDPQYTLESELDFIEVIKHGMDYYLGLANDAHQQWREVYSDSILKSDMMLTEDQQKKASIEALKNV